MKKCVLMFVVLAASLSVLSSATRAEPSCSVWLWQSEGNYWQQCVYDDGSRKCFRATDDSGSNAQEISC